MTESRLNVLVPASKLSSFGEVLGVADALLEFYGGEGTLLSVVEVPEEPSHSEGAQALAAKHDATLTFLRITRATWDAERRTRQDELFDAVLRRAPRAVVRELEVVDTSVDQALLDEARGHDLVVMGSAARDDRTS